MLLVMHVATSNAKINNFCKCVLKLLFRKFGVSNRDQALIRALGPASFKLTPRMKSRSKSQLRQDIFVLVETKKKREGYFVEIGASNGIDLSNTWLLEAEFDWTGILVEAGRVWEKQLRANRPNVSIETLCVWKDSYSKLTFNEVEIPESSTIESLTNKAGHANGTLSGKKYEIQTISLYDLLKKYQAPKRIDYLSIDTEGSEYEILKSFNFNEYHIGIISVEHNYTPQRELIFALLNDRGYVRKHERVSAWDDWYVKVN